MDVSAEAIQIIIQGGAVGLLLVFGYWGQRLARQAIESVNLLFTNHLEHTNEALGKIDATVAVGNAKLDELNSNVRDLSSSLRDRTSPRAPDA